jgi:hypothetical protein
MNTSTQHPPRFPGTPQEGNLLSPQKLQVASIQRIIGKINGKIGKTLGEMKLRKKKFLTKQENQQKIEEIALALEQSKEILFLYSSHIRKMGGLNRPDSNGDTILTLLAAYNQTEILELLLAHPKILVNRPDSDGYTAFIMASWGGHTKIAQLLLADPRLDLKAHDQWKIALQKAKTPEIKALIEEAMKNQGIES